MLDFITPLEQLATKITAAGVTASTDPTKLQPPCAWVHADKVEIVTLDDGIEMNVFIDLVVPNYAPPAAMRALGDLLGKVLTVVDADGPIELDRAVELSQGGVLPAFRVPVTLHD